MDREEVIPASYVDALFTALFDNPVILSQAYSEFDQSAVTFSDLSSLIAYVGRGRSEGETFFDFRAHFLEANGYTELRRISLIPAKCSGATWRETLEGWGLVQLQIKYLDGDMTSFRIAVNSEKRALNWYQTFPELRDPALWDWKVVAKHARRLIRLLRKGS